MTKIHIDDFISCHVVGCSKLATNQFVAKLCPEIYSHIGKLACKNFNQLSNLLLVLFSIKRNDRVSGVMQKNGDLLVNKKIKKRKRKKKGKL